MPLLLLKIVASQLEKYFLIWKKKKKKFHEFVELVKTIPLIHLAQWTSINIHMVTPSYLSEYFSVFNQLFEKEFETKLSISL